MAGRCVHCRRKPSECGRTFVYFGNWCCSDCAFRHEYGYPDDSESRFAGPEPFELQALFDRDLYLR